MASEQPVSPAPPSWSYGNLQLAPQPQAGCDPRMCCDHLTTGSSWDNGQGWSQGHSKTHFLVHLVCSASLFFLLPLHPLPSSVFYIRVSPPLPVCPAEWLLLPSLPPSFPSSLPPSLLTRPKGMDPGSAPGRMTHPALGWAQGYGCFSLPPLPTAPPLCHGPPPQ